MEFVDYRRVGIDTSVVVDRSRGEKLNVHFNVTFPRLPCYRELTATPLIPVGPVPAARQSNDSSVQFYPSTSWT